jgi:hypothetical protein
MWTKVASTRLETLRPYRWAFTIRELISICKVMQMGLWCHDMECGHPDGPNFPRASILTTLTTTRMNVDVRLITSLKLNTKVLRIERKL